MKNQLIKNLDRFRYILLGGTLAVAVSVLSLQLHADNDTSNHPPVQLKVDQSPIPRQGPGMVSFSPVVKEVTPSVVKVYVSAKAKPMDNPFFGNTPFGPGLFGPQFRQGPRGNMPMPDRQGLGSGVIVTKDGYILTNNHVVEEADEVKVMLSDNSEYAATVVGTDPQSDIAVLKIEATDLPAVTLSDSDELEVGDLVLAIGNPFNVGQTVTMGIVSATGRGNMGLDYEDFIQTDAAINPGNSGGALVDAQGRLIGINTAIISGSGGNQGIGFAVPVNLARNVMENLVEHGRVIRGFLGVNIQNVNQALADAFKLNDAHGALVAQVSPDSPAEAAGLKEGDVIVEFNGRKVTDSRQLKNIVGQTVPGRNVSMNIVREGKPKVLTAKLEEKESTEVALGKPAAKKGERLVGVGVTDINPDVREQLDLPENVNGALVSQVLRNSPAYKSGLREGDVILEIDRKKVDSSRDAVKLADQVKSDQILLRVWSKGGTRYLVVNESGQS